MISSHRSRHPAHTAAGPRAAGARTGLSGSSQKLHVGRGPSTPGQRRARATQPSQMKTSGPTIESLLFQVLLDPDLAIEGARMERAQARLRTLLPERRV